MKRRAFLSALVLAAALPATAMAAEDNKKKGGGANYTQFPMITVFTQANSTHHGTMSVEVGLYADDPKMTAQIALYIPRLQDAYLSRLQAYAANLNSRSMVDTDYVSGQLQAATNQVLGKTGAHVLLGSIMLN
ncbi:MAG: Tat pathway signal protein [Asticcacaulis sp.]